MKEVVVVEKAKQDETKVEETTIPNFPPLPTATLSPFHNTTKAASRLKSAIQCIQRPRYSG
jgi:hypothetical protein